MKYELEYREDGEKKIRAIEIDFVSNSMFDMHTQMQMDAGQVTDNFNKVQNNATKMVALKSLNTKEKDKEAKQKNKDEIKALKEENDKLVLTIVDEHANDYFGRRLEIIRAIFKANHITDEKFMTREFWQECVDYNHMIILIKNIVEKDAPKKKVT